MTFDNSELRTELRRRLEKKRRPFDRGAITEREYGEALITTMDDFRRDFFPAPSSLRGLRQLYLDVVLEVELPFNALDWFYRWTEVEDRPLLADIVDRAFAAQLADNEGRGLEDPIAFDLATALLDDNAVPARVVALLPQARPLSLTARFALAYAAAQGDDASADWLVARDAALGCTWMLAWRILNLAEAARLDDAAAMLAITDIDRLVEAQSWGDLTNVAVSLAVARLDAAALAFSGAVADDEIVDNREPGRRRATRSFHFSSEKAYSIECYEAGLRLMPPLAVVDLLCGDPVRARRRALRYTTPREELAWDPEILEAMARWVQASVEPDPQRQQGLLESISYPRHGSLGLLRAQVEADLADLAGQRGDHEAEAHHRRRSDEAKRSKSHAWRFEPRGPVDDNILLRRLPIAS